MTFTISDQVHPADLDSSGTTISVSHLEEGEKEELISEDNGLVGLQPHGTFINIGNLTPEFEDLKGHFMTNVESIDRTSAYRVLLNLKVLWVYELTQLRKRSGCREWMEQRTLYTYLKYETKKELAELRNEITCPYCGKKLQFELEPNLKLSIKNETEDCESPEGPKPITVKMNVPSGRLCLTNAWSNILEENNPLQGDAVGATYDLTTYVGMKNVVQDWATRLKVFYGFHSEGDIVFIGNNSRSKLKAIKAEHCKAFLANNPEYETLTFITTPVWCYMAAAEEEAHKFASAKSTLPSVSLWVREGVYNVVHYLPGVKPPNIAIISEWEWTP